MAYGLKAGSCHPLIQLAQKENGPVGIKWFAQYLGAVQMLLINITTYGWDTTALHNVLLYTKSLQYKRQMEIYQSESKDTFAIDIRLEEFEESHANWFLCKVSALWWQMRWSKIFIFYLFIYFVCVLFCFSTFKLWGHK